MASSMLGVPCCDVDDVGVSEGSELGDGVAGSMRLTVSCFAAVRGCLLSLVRGTVVFNSMIRVAGLCGRAHLGSGTLFGGGMPFGSSSFL